MNKNAFKNAIAATFATALFTACAHVEAEGDESTVAQISSGNTTPAAQPSQPLPVVQAPVPIPVSNTSSHLECGSEDIMNNDHYLKANGKKAEAVKIRVTGYGAPPKAFYPDPQRRLMAMRAAKIDAYRSLAERVSGLQIWGGTTIGDMVVEKDRFRVYLDTHLTGARVIAESGQEDGTYETVVELKVDQTFLNQTLPEKRFNLECKEKMSRSVNISEARPMRSGMSGNLQNSNFYYQDQ